MYLFERYRIRILVALLKWIAKDGMAKAFRVVTEYQAVDIPEVCFEGNIVVILKGVLAVVSLS